MSTKKEDFKCNVEKLACGNDKLQLLDELMKLKNNDGFNLLEILTALTAYDDPKFKNQRDEVLTYNCANVLKAELLIYDFGEYYNYNENNKSIEEALTLLESDRFKVKTVLNVSSDSDSLYFYKKNTVFENSDKITLLNPLNNKAESKIDEKLFLHHRFYLTQIDCYDENPVYKKYTYCRIKDICDKYDLTELEINEETIDFDTSIIFDDKLEQVFISCVRMDQDLILLISAKTFELGWGVHSRLTDLNSSVVNKYISKINNDCNSKYYEIYNKPLYWIKEFNIPNNQLSFYNDIFTIDTSIKNIINIAVRIHQDGYDISDYEMLECNRLEDRENYDDMYELYIIFKNKFSNEEFLILYNINTKDLSFGYTAKNGENFSPLYDIKTCIDNFDPNYCYLYR